MSRQAVGARLLVIVCGLFLTVGCLLPPDGVLKVGSVAPEIETKTLYDVGGDFSRITSYRYPDERMYQWSIKEALAMGKPILVEFATPGHCTVCDKQLQMLKALMVKYEGEVLFIHMDQYYNPEAFISFDVRGDPWTFMIGADRVVQFKRAGRMLYSELVVVIDNALAVGQG